MSTVLFWFTLAFILALMLTSDWRAHLTGEKKRDFGFDDLTTLSCSECLV